jgi:arsenate reductase
MIRLTGEEPVVIEYLRDPPSREKLVELIAATGFTPRRLLREKGTPYADLDPGDQSLSDENLLDAMMELPILNNRPLVEAPRGVCHCRPSEVVQEILEKPLSSDFVKDDGEIVRARR